LITWQRSNATVAAIPGWEKVASIQAAQSLEVWLRLADGTATDTPSPDWSGTGSSGAFIEAYYGDVYTDVANAVAHSATENSSANTGLVLPALTGGSIAECEVYGVAIKNNTATDATTISHTSLTVRTQVVSTINGRSHVATGNLQQATYADFDGTDFTINGTSEALSSKGIIMYLRTETASVGSGLVLPTMYRKPNVLLRM
jgi:hypothetical protein